MNRQTRGVYLAATAASALLTAAVSPAMAEDLFPRGNWPALASDRLADRIGDSLTVVIFESASATNSTQMGSKKSTRLSGQITSGVSHRAGASANLDGAFDGAGQTGRADKMVGQIGVVVDGLLPNGDLHVAGEEYLNINGERTKIRLKGRVRRSDLLSDNTVLSTRLADVTIDYDGRGFTTRSGKPGAVNRIFNWLGLL